MVVEIGETRFALGQQVGPDAIGSVSIEQRHEQALVQLGSDEAQPLLQAKTVHAGARRELRGGKAVGDVLQDCGVLAHDLAVVGTD